MKTGAMILLLSFLAACGDEMVEFERDAGIDAGIDAGSDVDAGTDAGLGEAPTVTATLPVNAATEVASDTALTATFSQAMSSATISTTTFTVKQGTTNVAGLVTFDGATNTATFTPDAALGNSLLYTATITTGAQDAAGLALAQNHGWSFTTAARPAVTSTVPAKAATGVALNTFLLATFGKAMDSATISTTSFTVKQGTTDVSGNVTYATATKTATFAPAEPLGESLVYTATITTGAADVEGLALSQNYTWTFTTAASAEPPMVDSTNPLEDAINVSISKKPTATFSKAMAPSTLTKLTFTVTKLQGSPPATVPVTGTVTLDGETNTATFTPNAALEVNRLYTATITTGATDTGNTALAAPYVWTFTTAACSQATIDLRSAANFVVLAGSAVSSTGQTTVTGDLGVSAGTAVTGFPPGSVVGAEHAGDPTAAQGIADLTTAYNDAAGRTLCPVTKDGNLGGQTLPPGLYKSGSSLAISSGDLTLDAQGDSDAIFIFQMASTLTTTSGRQVILTNGAKSANIFWQVGSSATLGTTTAFQGTIMADQAITLETGATLNGRVLARIGAVTLDGNTLVKPAQ